MKYLLILTLMMPVLGYSKTIKEGDKEYTCSPVRTCEEELALLKKENKRLKKLLSEKKVETVTVEVEKVVEVETEVIKKHIVSLLIVNGVKELKTERVSADTVRATAKTGLVPAVAYQYQMDIGLTPLLGLELKTNANLLFGLGYEF